MSASNFSDEAHPIQDEVQPKPQLSVMHIQKQHNGYGLVQIMVVMPDGRYAFATLGDIHNPWHNLNGDPGKVPA